jgi:tetratricopeptide (TPR) repeat protein/MFS family permease
LIPYIIVFTASASTLVIEIVAGRILAPDIGVSIYTWTSIIGVVLAGISIGAYLGGMAADRFPQQRTLGLILLAGGLSSLSVLPLVGFASNVFAGLPLQARIVFLTASLFFLPSLILGMVTPVVIKLRLRDLASTGNVVGKIFAVSNAGAIFGTFITGFVLIQRVGSRLTLIIVAVVLVAMALAFGDLWQARMTGVAPLGLFVVLVGFTYGNGDLESVCLRESAYFCIQVSDAIEDGRAVKVLELDGLVHSYIAPNDPTVLINRYQQVLADLATVIGERDGSFRALFVGGGGYTLPKYLEEVYPQSVLEVIEIDPEVTQVAFDYFGLRPDTRISIFHQDARMAVPQLATGKYDLVIGDAFISVSVPYHLTTLEFNQQIRALLTEDGIYAINVIDKLHSGNFLRAFANTLGETFPYVYVLRDDSNWDDDARNTHVLTASSRPLSLADINQANLEAGRGDTVSNFMSAETFEAWLDSGQDIVLTDDYAPVDNMLASVALEGDFSSSQRHYNAGLNLEAEGRFEEAIAEYDMAISSDPGFAPAFNNRGGLYGRLGDLQLAIEDFDEAIRLDPQYALAFFNRGLAYSAIGDVARANADFARAAELGADMEELRGQG